MLSIRGKVAGPQLQLISLGVLPVRLAGDDDDHDEDGQQDEDAANGHRHHSAVTHKDDCFGCECQY